MQRESPTDATVTTHSSMITNVTVVPEVSAETWKGMFQKIRVASLNFTGVSNRTNKSTFASMQLHLALQLTDEHI
jgi:hypothetical protein